MISILFAPAFRPLRHFLRGGLYYIFAINKSLSQSEMHFFESFKLQDSALSSKPNTAEQAEIIRKIWPRIEEISLDTCGQQYEQFLEYIYQEIHLMRDFRPYCPTGASITALDLIEDLKNSRNEPRRQLLERLSQRLSCADKVSILRRLDFTARCWLTLDIRSEDTIGPVQPYTKAIIWQNDESLDEMVQKQFSHHHLRLSAVEGKIDPAFTAAYLEETCGIHIHWTDNLADHLQYDRRERLVTMYQHKICLLNHSKSKEEPMIPDDVLWETIDTLNLLFPFGDAATKALLARHGKCFYGIGFCGRTRVLDITQYPYWGRRLLDVIEAFNEPPRRWKQLVHDRRNLAEWATFWIGVCVLILTIVSIPAGIASVISMRYSIMQYNLAIAQACAEVDRAPGLSGFCAQHMNS